jgi:pyruvate,orthophosphate dikinase
VLKLKDQMPKSYAELLKVRATLEKHFKDVQDIEFTIQEGKLFMLQTRNGKRTAAAALKFSIDMVKEKLIDWQTAVMRNPADQLEQLLAPIFDLAEVKKAKVIATGLPAGPGAATGKIYFNADRAVHRRREGREGPPRPRRDLPRGSPRHDRRRGHPHRPRRGLLARRARRPPDGQGLRLRRRRRLHRLRQEDRHHRRPDLQAKATSSPSTAPPALVYAGQIKTAPSEIIAGLLNGDKAAQKPPRSSRATPSS